MKREYAADDRTRRRRYAPLRASAVLLWAVASWLAPQTAHAGAPSLCLDEHFPDPNHPPSCTANDVSLTEAEVLAVIDGCTDLNDTATVTFRMKIEIGAAQRYDPAFWIATDGNDAKSGSCFKEYLPTAALLDPGYGPHLDLDGDLCGDAVQNDINVSPLYRVVSIASDPNQPIELTLPCRDANLNGIIDFAYCAGWDQNADANCSSLEEAGIPGTSSKCNCDEAVDLPGVLVPREQKLEAAFFSVEKTVMLAGGDCAVDAVAGPLNLPSGTSVEYCYAVKAAGTPLSHQSILDLTLIDDMATAVNADDQEIILLGLTDEDDDTFNDDLQAGQTATGKMGPVTLQ